VKRHLTQALIQAYLDGRASRDEARAVVAHSASCASCRNELEDWAALFGELGHLPSLAPSAQMRSRVMEHVAKVRPLASRPGEAAAPAHPTPDRLIDYVDDALPQNVAASVQAHLAECAHCAREVGEFRQVFAQLDGLAHVQASAGFQDRVMRQVRVPSPRTVPAQALGARALAAVRRLRPAPRRWAALAGVATAPLAVLAIVGSVVLSHPLVTLWGMVSYAWWKAGQVASLLVDPLLSGVVQSVAIFRAYTAFEWLAQSLLVTAVGVGVLCALTGGAAWFLYRNVLVASSTGRKYATIRV
jgi:anti-sigma factor RsiW